MVLSLAPFLKEREIQIRKFFWIVVLNCLNSKEQLSAVWKQSKLECCVLVEERKWPICDVALAPFLAIKACFDSSGKLLSRQRSIQISWQQLFQVFFLLSSWWFIRGYFQVGIIYDWVRNRKNYFEIAAFLNFERTTSRVWNSNENKNTNTNKHISFATKCDISLNFPALNIPCYVQLAERREFQNNFSCSVPYHI